MKRRDPLAPPPWVREAIAGRRQTVKVNPEDDASMDAYLAGVLARAPKSWHDAMAAIVAGKAPKAGKGSRKP